ILVPAVAAAGLVTWSVISAIASDAPWGATIFGWWLRADGLLATVGAGLLLLSAATLAASEVPRVLAWILGGASLMVVVGLAQMAGASIMGSTGGPVLGTLGNTNYAAGYFAIVAVLSLGCVMCPGPTWQRVWAGVLAAMLIVLVVGTGAIQGPAALAGGLLGAGVGAAVMNRGPRRRQGLAAVGIIAVLSLALVAATVAGSGPLAWIMDEGNTRARMAAWETGWNILNARPILGTGPGGLARYFGEFRNESVVVVAGPDARPSALHNIALQFGVTVGWLGLALWIILVAGALWALFGRMMAGPVRSPWLAVSVLGAFVAYVTQGLVSVDTPPLLGMGWLVMGLALALAREPAAESAPSPAVSGRRDRSTPKGSSRRPSPRPAEARTPAWVPITGATLGVVGMLLVGWQMATAQTAFGTIDPKSLTSVMTNPMMPCPLRVDVANDVLAQLPADVALPAVTAAASDDPRCPPIVHIQSEAALDSNDLALADASTSEGLELDPTFARAWLLRA
ncbi:MAG: O-antigen ligase family protein, partial [Anaerolineae bacterium]